jgi:hypothetical protein
MVNLSIAAPLPDNYESWTAADKQDYLWNQRILLTAYTTLPPLTAIDVIGLFLTPLRIKMDRQTDQVPRTWKKAIHAHASVATVRYISQPGTPYTGVFRDAQHGLIRLSLTGDPARRGFAPGMALKLLRDKVPSANLSALVSLTGQGENYNYFANDLSNIVPVVPQIGPKLINQIFRRVSRYPTKLFLENLAEYDQNGTKEPSPVFPEQIFFVPNPQLGFPAAPVRDFREDLASLSPETVLYDVLATPPDQPSGDDLRAKATKIGTLVLSSPFVSSAYGDDTLFFRHQRFGNR